MVCFRAVSAPHALWWWPILSIVLAFYNVCSLFLAAVSAPDPFLVLADLAAIPATGAAPEGKGAHVLGLRAYEEDRQLCGSAALAQVDEPRAQHGAVLQRHVGAGIDVGGHTISAHGWVCVGVDRRVARISGAFSSEYFTCNT